MRRAQWRSVLLGLLVSVLAGHGRGQYYSLEREQAVEGDALVRSVQDVKHVFVLFSNNLNKAENEHIRIYNEVSSEIKKAYNTSTLFWVLGNKDQSLSEWENNCPKNGEDCLCCFEKPLVDRTCLMTPPQSPSYKHSTVFEGDLRNAREVEMFLKIESEILIGDIFQKTSPAENLYKIPVESNGLPPKCAAVDSSEINFESFFREYWLPQKPVVIKNVINVTNLPLLQILSKYHDVTVGAKLSPDVEFEGVDSLLNWEMAGEQDVPKKVLGQLQSPDMVVVRAAHEDMTLGRVMSLLKTSSQKKRDGRTESETSPKAAKAEDSNITNVYVEYMQLDSVGLSSLRNELLNITNRKELHNDKYPGFPTWIQALRDGTPYLWLGDGRAVGKVHFDPFDNLLLQLEGGKRFTLVDTSDNRRLYEGHMREAQLEAHKKIVPKSSKFYNHYRFQKRRLLESTSMVHTPIDDIRNPNIRRFPRATGVGYIDCNVDSGDMLFVPSFWWHEVDSSPGFPRQSKNVDDPDPIRLNVAINYWFDPLFLKEYPCATCTKYLNKKYASMILEKKEIIH